MKNETPDGLTMSYSVKFSQKGDRQKSQNSMSEKSGKKQIAPQKAVNRTPRVVKLLALAHHFDELIRNGVVKDYADLARLGGVSRARITQIMGFLLLAPDIQERILLCKAHSIPPERTIRKVIKEISWEAQKNILAQC